MNRLFFIFRGSLSEKDNETGLVQRCYENDVSKGLCEKTVLDFKGVHFTLARDKKQ